MPLLLAVNGQAQMPGEDGEDVGTFMNATGEIASLTLTVAGAPAPFSVSASADYTASVSYSNDPMLPSLSFHFGSLLGVSTSTGVTVDQVPSQGLQITTLAPGQSSQWTLTSNQSSSFVGQYGAAARLDSQPVGHPALWTTMVFKTVLASSPGGGGGPPAPPGGP